MVWPDLIFQFIHTNLVDQETRRHSLSPIRQAKRKAAEPVSISTVPTSNKRVAARIPAAAQVRGTAPSMSLSSADVKTSGEAEEVRLLQCNHLLTSH